jgi:uncharacterized protein YecT (DUF1311 family)
MPQMKSMVWLMLATLAVGAHASEEESTPCDNVETDQQNYECAHFSRTSSERELEAAFADLQDRIKEQYAGKATKIAELSKRLNDAEAIWKQLRDADCRVETYDIPAGKAFEAAQNTCIAQRNDDRSEYLQSLGLPTSD